jgi:PKD repeat protein
MHIITPYNPWAPKKKKKTWQEELWEQQQIAELEAKVLSEASSRTLPQNSPAISVATAGPMVNAGAGAGGAPRPNYFNPNVNSITFTINPLTGAAPFTANFINDSSPDAVQHWSWTWNFGDGSTSAERAPVHVYANTGSYTVSLTGSSPQGVVTQSVRTNYVSASRPDMPIAVTFTPTQTTGSVPLAINFVNTTANFSSTGVNTYKWIFSGSTKPVTPITTSVVASPTVVFYDTGSYSIKLETTGSWNVTGSAYYLLAVSAST